MKKRGKGIACMVYPIGFTSYPNPSAAFVQVNQDGTAVVLTGATDVGQGSTTVLAQIAAEELGIAYDAVTMVTSDTQRTPFDLGSVASRVTYITGNAVQRAAGDAKKTLLQVAAEMLDVCRLPARAEVDAHDINARPLGIDVGGFAVVHRALPHSPELGRIQRFRRESRDGPPCPHLDEDHVVAVVGHDVNLAPASAHVARDHAHARRLDPVPGDPLAEFA